MAYCETGDLLTSGIPVQDGELAKYVNLASDEIDSYLADRYVTPVTVNPALPRERKTSLVLKRIAIQLASGRLITSKATGGQDTDVHAYGLLLLNQAIESLKALAAGSFELPGATEHEPSEDVVPPAELRGAIFNGDAQSEVDAFYSSATPHGLMRGGIL